MESNDCQKRPLAAKTQADETFLAQMRAKKALTAGFPPSGRRLSACFIKWNTTYAPF
jgi:hypothetical protein